MPIRHKPLSRLTGCGRLIRIIAPPVPLFSATRTVGSPLYSIRGREEVSLCPCRLIAPCLPHKDDEMRLSLGLCHLRVASSAAPPHGICTRKLVWNCQCSTKEKNPFTNNQVLGGKGYALNEISLKLFDSTRQSAYFSLNYSILKNQKSAHISVSVIVAIFISDTKCSIKRNDLLVILKTKVLSRELDCISGLVSVHVDL